MNRDEAIAAVIRSAAGHVNGQGIRIDATELERILGETFDAGSLSVRPSTGDEPICPMCGRRYSLPYQYDAHMKGHLPVRPSTDRETDRFSTPAIKAHREHLANRNPIAECVWCQGWTNGLARAGFEVQIADAVLALFPLPLTTTREALVDHIHHRALFDADDCDHGTYSGGPSHGEPYKMCERKADALLGSGVLVERSTVEAICNWLDGFDWGGSNAGEEWESGDVSRLIRDHFPRDVKREESKP